MATLSNPPYSLTTEIESVSAGYAKGVWAVAGPLVGVLVGAYIASRNQRKQWLADNKKQEYRELLAAMTKGMTASFFHRSKWSPSGPTAEKLLASYPREVVNLAEIIQTGIFAAPVTTKLNLLRRWHAALEMPIGGMAANDAFARVVGELLDNVRDAAREDVGA